PFWRSQRSLLGRAQALREGGRSLALQEECLAVLPERRLQQKAGQTAPWGPWKASSSGGLLAVYGPGGPGFTVSPDPTGPHRQAAGALCLALGRPGLQKFRIPKGRLGLTRKVPALALIELTTLCDVLGLDPKKSKAGKRKATETCLFSVSLDTLLEADRRSLPSTQVLLLLSCLEERGLDTSGILRVPGSKLWFGFPTSLRLRLPAPCSGLEHKLNHNDASDLLQTPLQALLALLLTAEHPGPDPVPAVPSLFIQILPEPSRNIPKEKLPCAAFTLPPRPTPKIMPPNVLIHSFHNYARCPQVVQHDVLGRALLEFFPVARGAEQHDDALERFHGDDPSSLPAPRGTPKLPRGREKQLAEGTAEVVWMIAQYQDLLCTLCDGGLKTWLRRMHADRNKAKDGPELVTGTHDQAAGNGAADCGHQGASRARLSERGGRVSETREVTRLSKEEMVEQNLSPAGNRVLVQGEVSPSELKAIEGKEPVACFSLSYSNRSIKSARNLLHGVRGNISEHRLDPDAHLLDLYCTNPHGEWGSSYRTPPKPLGSKKQPGCHIPAPAGWVYSAWEHRCLSEPTKGPVEPHTLSPHSRLGSYTMLA
ncbi:hypothetical protein EI555_014550, partial [Monodon monoceros]